VVVTLFGSDCLVVLLPLLSPTEACLLFVLLEAMLVFVDFLLMFFLKESQSVRLL
jgi:hypothetical protein